MAIDSATFPWADRHATGTLHWKNIYTNTFGYTETRKKVSVGSSTAILAATNGATATQTVTAGIVQPDVPRVLSVTPTVNNTGGNPMSITVNGVNVEGKPFSEVFIIPVGSTTIVNGIKAFKSVTSVVIPQQTSGLTITVGTLNKLGINHRLFNQQTTVKVFSATAAYGTLTQQGAPTVVSSEAEIERNTVSPATTPDGSTFYVIAYTFDNWEPSAVNDNPNYSTTTSTSSTSTSTSTTTITTSTSSTSVSTSSTSVSTTSTSLSTSSTSTSTTTTP